MLEQALTVSQLNAYIKNLFDHDPLLPEVRLIGEISNWRPAASGHLYFTLKDDNALIRCVMFRQNAMRLRFHPANGMSVVLSGYVGVYVKDGQYQFYTSAMREAGKGNLYLAFEALKKQLEGEGLFDTSRKRALPPRPKTIGIVTSPTGAAIQDMIRIATRRDPHISLILYPARVQGEGAAAEIAAGIRMLNQYPGIEMIVTGRGGGSIEDLWSFNEEIVARAIAESRLPVLSAVGHETDFTIADFVADLRAPTPSAAMEVAVPLLRDGILALDEWTRRLERRMKDALHDGEKALKRLSSASCLRHPMQYYAYRGETLQRYEQRLHSCIGGLMQRFELKGLALGERLEALSPKRVLARGYAYVERTVEKTVVTSAADLVPETSIMLHFHDGQIAARTEEGEERT